MGTPRRRAGVLGAALAAVLLVLPAVPAWAADDDRLLTVENTTWRTEVVQADGTDGHVLHPGVPDSGVAVDGGDWLPDASAVVLRQRTGVGPSTSGTPSLVLVARDGSTRRTLLTDPGILGVPAVTPDGRTVAWASSGRMDAIGTDGRGRRTLATVGAGEDVGELAWSPDGQAVLASVGTADGTRTLQRFAGGQRTAVSAPGEVLAQEPGIAVSPDGTAVAYAVQDEQDAAHVVVSGPDGHRVLTGGSRPAWSPSGRYVAAVQPGVLRIVEATTGAEVDRVELDSCLLSTPSWSPDSRHLAFSTLFSGAACAGQRPYVLELGGQTRSLDAVRGSKYGHQVEFAPLPTTAPALRSGAAACPPGRVPEDGLADAEPTVFEADIDCVAWWGLSRGTGTGYSPERPVTRVQTALLLARLLHGADVAVDTSDPGFGDTASLSAEAREAIAVVANADVARGTSATTFTPGAPVTRGQLASLLVRLQGALDVALPDRVRCFHDTYASAHAGAAQQLCAAGVAVGDGAGTFSPGTAVTRGQVAGLLARSLDVAVEAGTLEPPAA